MPANRRPFRRRFHAVRDHVWTCQSCLPPGPDSLTPASLSVHLLRPLPAVTADQDGRLSPETLAALRAIALHAARAGAAAIARNAGTQHTLEWESKLPADFVSRVDCEAEDAVVAVLREFVPGATLLLEESAPGTDISRGLGVVVDPLDGTTNFLHDYPWYATSVGVTWNSVPVAGAVVNAATNEAFVGALGLGAHRVAQDNTTRTAIHVSHTTDPMRALVGTGFPFKQLVYLEQYQRQFAKLSRSCSGIRRAGAAALDLCDVACGRFEGFWELVLAPWDTAAGMIIVREAGGRVTDLDGNDAPVAHVPIVASNGGLHSWLLDALA